MTSAQQNALGIYRNMGAMSPNFGAQSPQTAFNIWQQTGQNPPWWNAEKGMTNQAAAAEAGPSASPTNLPKFNLQQQLQRQVPLTPQSGGYPAQLG